MAHFPCQEKGQAARLAEQGLGFWCANEENGVEDVFMSLYKTRTPGDASANNDHFPNVTRGNIMPLPMRFN